MLHKCVYHPCAGPCRPSLCGSGFSMCAARASTSSDTFSSVVSLITPSLSLLLFLKLMLVRGDPSTVLMESVLAAKPGDTWEVSRSQECLDFAFPWELHLFLFLYRIRTKDTHVLLKVRSPEGNILKWTDFICKFSIDASLLLIHLYYCSPFIFSFITFLYL